MRGPILRLNSFRAGPPGAGGLPQSKEAIQHAIDIRFDIRNVLQPLGDRDRIASRLREAEQLANRIGDRQRNGWVQSYLTEQFWMLGRYRESIEEEALLPSRSGFASPGRDQFASRIGPSHARRLQEGPRAFRLERRPFGRQPGQPAFRDVRLARRVLA